MEYNKEISPIIYRAIEILKKCFDGMIHVELLSDEMYRLAPSEDAPAGKLGVDIKINGIQTFLGCESMAEPICEYGEPVANEFIVMIMKTAYPNWFTIN